MKKAKLFLALLMTAGALSLTGCDLFNSSNTSSDVTTKETENHENDERYKIFLLAKQSGFDGTYEEWLDSIKGDFVQMRVSNTDLEWKYSKDTNWTKLITLTDLVTAKEAKEIEISTSATHITWRYVGENGWKNLVEIATLHGNDGDSAYDIAVKAGFNGTVEAWIESLKGVDGKQVELRTANNKLEWKYATDTEWQELVTLTDLVVQKEAKEIEISTSATHIVWRYEGENGWHDLVDLSSLVGNAGKSAYDIAKEVGFTGTAEEWVESLKGEKGDTGNGILKIEKTKSDGLVDYYTIYYTNGTTYEFEINNGSVVDDDIAEESKYLIGLEVFGKGYIICDYLSSDSVITNNVVIPSTYNGKKIYSIQTSRTFKNLTIPNTIETINYVYAESLFFDGTEEELFDVESNNINSRYIYVLDENGTIENNGKNYRLLCSSIHGKTINNYNFNGTISEFLESNIYNSKSNYLFNNLFLNGKEFNGQIIIADGTEKLPDISRVLDINSIIIPSSVDYIGKDIFKNLTLKSVYYNGSLLDYSRIEFENEYSSPLYNKNNTNLYVMENGDYKSIKDLTITDEFDFEDSYWYYGIYGNQVVIDKRNSYSSNLYDFVKNFDIVIFNDTFASNESLFISNPYYYFLDDDGSFEYLGNKYNNYGLISSGVSNTYTNQSVLWNPLSLANAKSAYNVSGDIDLWLVYSKSYGSTYNGVIKSSTTQNPIDGITYNVGDTLPAWQAFASKLGIAHINQGGIYGYTDDDNHKNFKAAKDSYGIYQQSSGAVDLYYNTIGNLSELGDNNDLVDLTEYIDSGRMPALKKFLDDNPAVKQEITYNGRRRIFYTPYMDGYQAVERGFVMDTEQVAKLLDDDLPAGLGHLAAGLNGDAKGLNSTPKAEAFIGNNGKNYIHDLKIKIVNPRNATAAVEVTVKQTDNILNQQNMLLAQGTTGKALIDQFKSYARAAYGDIIDTYYDGKISKMFTSVGACYNADDLIALLRIFKANPDVLYGSADFYDEVVPVFPRGQANNRVENILNFGATLYGVQGRGSECDHLFFGADGKIHDFDTAQQSYDLLDKLNALYSEGLIQANFWSGSSGTGGLDTYFKKTKDGTSTFGLLEYDYFATQSAANDIKEGIGTKPESRKTSASGYDFSFESVTGVMPILSPLTYVATESFDATQSLDDRTGKTVVRYYEENRSVKYTSWSIPKSSDNIDTAIALMDFMFTKEGWEIQNFGPEGYWDYGTVLGENTPIIKQTVLNHFATTGLDFWNYCRGFLGTTQGIGHYRPITLDYQSTNAYAREGYNNVVTACNLGVQVNSRVVNPSEYSWHATMPISVFDYIDLPSGSSYSGVTHFWSQSGKATADGTQNGWVAIVAEGKDYSGYVANSPYNGKYYTYSDVKAECTNKNTSYLYTMGKALGLVPDEAYDKN